MAIARHIAVLIFENAQILDAAGPIAAFEIAGRLVPGAYRIGVIAARAALVRTSSGISLAAEKIDEAFDCDTLIVAGGLGSDEASNDPVLLDVVRRTAGRARRTASVCSGASILAAAGLLDGRRATTHWNRGRAFQRRFPKVRLRSDRIFVRDGAVWTSAGISAGIDLALALIAEDCGEEVSRAVARQLVVPYRRMGGQSQFSPMLDLDAGDGKIGSALRWAAEHLDQPLGVEELAERTAMSPRNFARHFRLETGTTPAKAIERLRCDQARALIEDPAGLSVEEIARRSGFGAPERMRRSFLRIFGRPPQAFRRAAD